MILQVGPSIVLISADHGSSFIEVFDVADANISMEFEFIDRINDGVVIESVPRVINCSYEIIALKWSVDFLHSLLLADYDVSDSGPGPGEIIRSYLFDVLGITFEDPITHAISMRTVPETYLRFVPKITDKATYVDLPRVRWNGSLPLSFSSEQSSINVSGIALLDKTYGFVKIKFNDCTVV